MTTIHPHIEEPPVLLTVEEAAKQLRIGRSMVYALMQSGDLESIHIGRLRRIPADALPKFLARLRAIQATVDPGDVQ